MCLSHALPNLPAKVVRAASRHRLIADQVQACWYISLVDDFMVEHDHKVVPSPPHSLMSGEAIAKCSCTYKRINVW